MKMRSGAHILKWLSFCVLPLMGCKEFSPSQPGGKVKPPSVATNPTMSNGMWNVVKAECKHCHDGRGNHAYPADIDLSSKTSLTLAQVQETADAVRDERAPAFRKIAAADIDTILAWCQDRGADTTAVYVPSAWSWNQTNQIGSDANGTNLEGPGEFFAFAVEDYGRPDSLVVKTVDGIKGMKFFNLTPANDDSMDTGTAPTHRVTYIIPDGIAWNGRMTTGTVKGWVRQNRWMGFVVHGQMLKKGGSPYAAREPRTYVRVQVDRDWLSLRSKVDPADNTETYPWSGADPLLTASSGYSLNDGHFLLDSQNYWVKLTITLESGNMVYHAQLYDDDHDANSEAILISEVKGYRTDDENAYGSFCFFNYSENSSTKYDWWGGFEVYASGVKGSGTRVGGCKKNCYELD